MPFFDFLQETVQNAASAMRRRRPRQDQTFKPDPLPQEGETLEGPALGMGTPPPMEKSVLDPRDVGINPPPVAQGTSQANRFDEIRKRRDETEALEHQANRIKKGAIDYLTTLAEAQGTALSPSMINAREDIKTLLSQKDTATEDILANELDILAKRYPAEAALFNRYATYLRQADDLRKQAAKIHEEFAKQGPFPGAEEQKSGYVAQLEKQVDDLLKERNKPTTGLLRKREIDRQLPTIMQQVAGLRPQEPQPPAPTPEPQPPALTPTTSATQTPLPSTASDSIVNHLRAAGANPAKALREAKEALRKAGINPDDLRPVPWASALPTAWNIIDQEGMADFAQWYTHGADMQPPDASKGQSKMQQQLGAPTQRSELIRAQIREISQKLAEAEEAQNWGAIIGFILLSMVLGGPAAFLIFGKAIRGPAGSLRRQKEELYKELAQEEQREDEWRRFAAQQNMTEARQERQELRRFRSQFLLTLQRGEQELEQIRERARLKGSDTDSTADRLEKNFKEYLQLAASHAKNLKFEEAAAATEAAESVHQLMQRHRMQLEAAAP